MKKKFGFIKTVQLVLIMAVTAVALVMIFTDDALYQMIGGNASVRWMCAIMWLVLVIAYSFILWDFRYYRSFRRDYRELDYAVFNDRVSGIANRYSCDAMIEKYADRVLPDDLGCVMLDLDNIREINRAFGHTAGNDAIRTFSELLHKASIGLCFIGRNGGNKFMALFEHCTEEKINAFAIALTRNVEAYNAATDGYKLVFRMGHAYSRDEENMTVTQLISLADRRLFGRSDGVTGSMNRAACDDIIALYVDKPLPERIGCIMLELSNIREINETGYTAGNRAIRHFADILRDCSGSICTVGRNGGTKFLALFEECSEARMDEFLSAVSARVQAYNAEHTAAPLRYRFGCAYREDPEKVGNINRLIALSDRRMNRGETEHGKA